MYSFECVNCVLWSSRLAIHCRSVLYLFFVFCQGKKHLSWWQRILIPFQSFLATLKSLVKVCSLSQCCISLFFKLCLSNFVFLVNHVNFITNVQGVFKLSYTITKSNWRGEWNKALSDYWRTLRLPALKFLPAIYTVCSCLQYCLKGTSSNY